MIKVGQVWRDKDKRVAVSLVRVDQISTLYALIDRGGYKTRIRLDRLEKAFELVKDVDDDAAVDRVTRLLMDRARECMSGEFSLDPGIARYLAKAVVRAEGIR